MKSNPNNEVIVSIPYAGGGSIDYYSDRIIFYGKEIYYEDITGYSYLLSTYSHSINLIPTHNSKTVSLSISTGNDKKPIVFSKTHTMPMCFHSQNQNHLNIIFSKIVKTTNALLSRKVLNDLYSRIKNGEVLDIGGLIIKEDSIRKKGIFKEKELDEYGQTYINAGQVIVENSQGKRFFIMSLGNINAPLLAPLLDALFKQ